MVRRGLLLGAVAMAVAVLVGCASAPEPPRPATPEQIAALHEQQARDWWDSVSGGAPMPEVDVIEELPPEESYARQNECLQDADIPGVTVTDDGGWSFEGDVDGEIDFEDPLFLQMQQQSWICAQQFPPSGEDAYVLSASELAWLHDFYVQRHRPCLASLGFEAIDFPGREQFVVDEVGYPPWVPHDYSVSPIPTRMEWALLAERCPLPSLLDPYSLPGFGPAS